MNKYFSKVIVPYGVQIVEGFENNKKIKEVLLSKTVEEVQHSAFSGCKNLESINFPKNLKHMWPCAFSNCVSMKKIKLNKKLKTN